MMLIACPHCGPRNASEFRYVGELRPRPDPATADRVAWRSYLYLRTNPAGWTTETWLHQAGCRSYLTVERHTVSNEVREVRSPAAALGRGGEDQPAEPAGEHEPGWTGP